MIINDFEGNLGLKTLILCIHLHMLSTPKDAAEKKRIIRILITRLLKNRETKEKAKLLLGKNPRLAKKKKFRFD